MDVQEAPTGEPRGEWRRTHRRRVPFWKRKTFWIAVVAIGVAILMVLWLISSLGSHRGEVD